MRQRQHRQRHQPQRELRAPHLVRQQERRHHQERQLRQPRPLLAPSTRCKRFRHNTIRTARRLPCSAPSAAARSRGSGSKPRQPVNDFTTLYSESMSSPRRVLSRKNSDHPRGNSTMHRQVHHQPGQHRRDRRLAPPPASARCARPAPAAAPTATADTAWPPRRARSAPRPARVFDAPRPAARRSRKPLPARRNW